jgi:uncharacterized protein YdeI (YjbR/CyaY-like superfamily)
MGTALPGIELPVLLFPTQADWSAWLEEQHASAAGAWVKIAKKGTGHSSVSYAEAVSTALCYGWIDGQKAAFDEIYYVQRFTPRRPRSNWSQANREAATALIEAGLMRPAGLREVERAKANGRWEAAYAGARTATVPADLAEALAANPAARAFFETLDSTNRYAIIYRIGDAKKPDTRARRIEKFVTMLAEGQKIHP